MKKNLPKGYDKHEKIQQEEDQSQLMEQIIEEEPKQKLQDAKFEIRNLKKDSLFVTFSGQIQYGNFDEYNSLILYYSFVGGSDWKIISGRKTGLTQMASSHNDQIVWNFDFEITYEMTNLSGWPQLIIILYGTDFLGKTWVRGYGNVHMPTSTGLQKRKIRVFQPLPQSVISGILGYFQGCIAEYRDTQKTLATGEGREVTRTKSIGTVQIKVETMKYNFEKFGYE